MKNDGEQTQQGNGNDDHGQLVPGSGPEPRSSKKSAEEHARDQTEQITALFEWAKGVLETAGFLKAIKDARTREEWDAIKFDDGDPTLIMAIRDALHPGPRKSRKKHFQNLNESMLRGILRSRFKFYQNAEREREKLLKCEEHAAAAEEVREKREENVRFYGAFKEYKVRDHGGVFAHITEDSSIGERVSKWVQISRTRVELEAVTRSKQDDNWGVYVQITNMDGRVTRLAIPRNIINDRQGNIAGRLANLGVDVVRDHREPLPDFLLTTVEVVDDMVQDLARLMAVPTTGWYQLNNERWVFVRPHATKFPADLPSGELTIFQSEQLHLQHGFAVDGSVDEWREQIAMPFVGNSNVTLAVGCALAGPLTVWAGVPPGLFHIFCRSKHGKSLAAAIGQSVYGRPLIPNETVADPFGMSWLATANSIGYLIKVRSSLCAFFEELDQGKAQDIADAAYRIANGIDKTRLRGRELEPRTTYCVPGFSTGEEPMVDFLERTGVRVSEGMRTRFADIPAEVQPGSVFEKFNADEIPGLGNKFYPLLSQLYGAFGDAWLQHLVNLGPDKIRPAVSEYQRQFRSRPKIAALSGLSAPYQRSVIDRFATVAAACRMVGEARLLWQGIDTDTEIELCVIRWAERERLDPVVTAIVYFMRDRATWEGTASSLLTELNHAVNSVEALGIWLAKSENLQRLN
jgi:hypothetical protein